MDEKHMKVTNLMEEMVFNAYENLTKNMKVCKCDRCRMDTIAITLNNLQPRYHATQKGEVFARVGAMTDQFNATILSELIKAIAFVSEKPRHE